MTAAEMLLRKAWSLLDDVDHLLRRADAADLAAVAAELMADVFNRSLLVEHGPSDTPEPSPTEHVTDVRPLVVLDLDDAFGCWAEPRDPSVIVARLRETNSVAAQAVADQIEEQTRPPKPAEPTGWGAVVLASQVGECDGSYRWWTRYKGGGREAWIDSMGHAGRTWDDLDVVEVVSEGVTS